MAIDGKLPEFSFIIEAVASGYLDAGGKSSNDFFSCLAQAAST